MHTRILVWWDLKYIYKGKEDTPSSDNYRGMTVLISVGNLMKVNKQKYALMLESRTNQV